MTLWNPTHLEDAPALWFDGLDDDSFTLDGSAIIQCNDKSGNSRHLTQATAAMRPTRTANGISNDASDKNLGTSISGIADGTKNEYRIYIVASPAENRGGVPAQSTTGAPYYDYDAYNNNVVRFSGNTTTTSSPVTPLISITGDGLHVTEQRNSLAPYLISRSHSVGSGNKGCFVVDRIPSLISSSVNFETFVSATNPPVDNLSWTGFNLPGFYISSSGRFNGVIHEFILLLYTPTTDVDDYITGYLAWRHGLETLLPSGHTYETAAPQASDYGDALVEEQQDSVEAFGSAYAEVSDGVDTVVSFGGSIADVIDAEDEIESFGSAYAHVDDSQDEVSGVAAGEDDISFADLEDPADEVFSYSYFISCQATVIDYGDSIESYGGGIATTTENADYISGRMYISQRGVAVVSESADFIESGVYMYPLISGTLIEGADVVSSKLTTFFSAFCLTTESQDKTYSKGGPGFFVNATIADSCDEIAARGGGAAANTYLRYGAVDGR